MSTESAFTNWKKNDRYLACRGCKISQTPDYYGRSTVPTNNKLELTANPTDAMIVHTNAESYMRANHNTRIRGRCNDHGYAPPSRYMTPLLFKWQQNDFRPWMATHNARNDVLDCRSVGNMKDIFYGYYGHSECPLII